MTDACQCHQILDKPARVGCVVFRKGVSIATVIDAAKRNYEQDLEPGGGSLEEMISEFMEAYDSGLETYAASMFRDALRTRSGEAQ